MTDTEPPKLPDGWEWTGSGTRAITDGTVVSVFTGELCIVTTNVAYGYAGTFVPPSVILAVLKANGYNFTS